jgi:RNA polymerase sigma-70 factor (ECF subfamily)
MAPVQPPETVEAPLAVEHKELLDRLCARRGELAAFVGRRVPPGIDPEDLLQEALFLAARGIASVREPDRIVPWFYRILRRVLADSYGRAERVDALSTEANAPTGSEGALCDCAVTALDGLAPAYADVLRRVYLDDEEPAAVARALGTTTNNVTVRLHRARDALRRRLREQCGTTSARTCISCAC